MMFDESAIRKEAYSTDDMYYHEPRMWTTTTPQATPTGQTLHTDISNKGQEQAQSWTDFTQNTSCHGVRYIFEKSEHKFRRYIWLVVVVTAISVFVIQVGIRTGNYLEYKTTLDVGVFYKDHLEFPAITICNQNRHRTTAMAERDLYDIIDEVYKRINISQIPWEEFGDKVNGIDHGELTRQTGHQKHVFIDRCTWNGNYCDIDKDFKSVLTDLGLCYTFNSQDNTSAVSTPRAGAGSGLKLVINVEQYEYMRGPQDDAGIKILLHPPGEIPIMQEQGFAAAPGTHTLVAMKRSEVTTLQPPYGICHPNSPPVSQCYAHCQARDVINTCSCLTEYMQPFINNIMDKIKSEWECNCSPPCKQVRYEPQLSYAQLSKFNIDRRILDSPVKQKLLHESYLKAREMTQRYREDIKVKDTTDMTTLVDNANRLQHNLKNIRTKTTDLLNTSYYFGLPPILVPEPLTVDEDSLKAKYLNLEKITYDWDNNNIVHMSSNIAYVKDTFLQWNGSMYKFQQFTNDCLQEASEAKLNESSDSSREVEFYVPARCKAELQQKTSSLKTVLLSADFRKLDIEKVEAEYQNLLVSMFPNSTKAADAYNAHKACLRVLRFEVKESFPELYNNLESFTKVETLKHAIISTNKIIDTMEVLISVGRNLTGCDWVYYLAWNITDKIYTYGTKARNANDMVMESFDTMSEMVALMTKDVDSLGKSIIMFITGYMNESVTKIELATHMLSPQTNKAIEKLSAFESYSHIVIKSLQEKLTAFKNSLLLLYMTPVESPLRILSLEEIQNLELFKLIYATNRTDLQRLIDGLADNLTNVQDLIEMVFSEYQQNFQELLGVLPSAFREISDRLVALQDDLQVYAESTSLNANFFMENFLQLDVFYKDMSYEIVTQQEAFGLLSLLGEVGGFLGLLLGASVITVCELLDYVLLQVTARCTVGRRDRDPNMV